MAKPFNTLNAPILQKEAAFGYKNIVGLGLSPAPLQAEQRFRKPKSSVDKGGGIC
jgi:hypothetical protein